MTRAAVAVLAGLVLLTGCRSLTGRSAGQWVDDRAVTARVKARLAGEAASNLTRIHVDTYEGVVYLTGGVPSLEAKQRAELLAAEVSSVRRVINNMHVEQPPAASPPTDGRAGRHPLLARFPGIAQLEFESGTPMWTRFAAYDGGGRRVATVFAVTERAPSAVTDLRAEGFPVDHVALYGLAAEYVVLWHVSTDEVARLR